LPTALNSESDWSFDFEAPFLSLDNCCEQENLSQELLAPEYDSYLMAKIYFDAHEFQRCSATLTNDASSPLCFFLREYAKYMVVSCYVLHNRSLAELSLRRVKRRNTKTAVQ
jgi:hypothetical protein